MTIPNGKLRYAYETISNLQNKIEKQQSEIERYKTNVMFLKSEKTKILDLIEDAECIGDISKILRQLGR